jgi:acyl carrier protein
VNVEINGALTVEKHEEIGNFLLSVLIDQMNLPIVRSTVTDETLLGPEGLDLESLAFVELTLAAETEYSVSIPDGELAQLGKLNFGGLVADIAGRMAA